MTPTPDLERRFQPRAAREMAGMFDDVSGRYDLLNRLMTLGQDAQWRAAMWRAVPEDARVVLDLCTGNGASLAGLRRPGRLVLGMDVSPGMLAAARDALGRTGWAPRLAGADAFALPLRDGAVDAITVAFGMRNLRPRAAALAEAARVLAPGGTLVVLEASAPAPGPLAPFHAFHLRHVVPLLGRFSDDPSAYRYLAESIFEFGAGPSFERDLEGAGFTILERRAFMLGASRLWVARSRPSGGQARAGDPRALQRATAGPGGAGEMPHQGAGLDSEWRWWTGGQLVVSAALLAALVWGCIAFANSQSRLPLERWQRDAGWVLLIAGVIAFTVRTAVLAVRFLGPRRRA